MAKLIGYAVMNGGNLSKAVCRFCGKKYNSLEDANKCEEECLQKYLPELPEEITCPIPPLPFVKDNSDKNYF